MNYKELQAEVKRLAELTGLPRPSLNSKRKILEVALAELQAADAEDMANENGDINVAADSVEWQSEEIEVVTIEMSISTPDTVATVIATTVANAVDLIIPIATKIAKVTVGFAALSCITIAYFACMAWVHIAPKVRTYIVNILIPSFKLALRESIHGAFYYTQKSYGELVQVKALINGVPFIS